MLTIHVYHCVQVGTNGYFTFDLFDGYAPFHFDEFTYMSLVAPFFSDIDISGGVGEINYEIHTDVTSQSVISRIDAVISEHMQIDFNGKWLLVAQWDGVPEFGSDIDIVSIYVHIVHHGHCSHVT